MTKGSSSSGVALPNNAKTLVSLDSECIWRVLGHVFYRGNRPDGESFLSEKEEEKTFSVWIKKKCSDIEAITHKKWHQHQKRRRLRSKQSHIGKVASSSS